MRVNSAVHAALAHNGHPCSGRRLHGLGNIRKECEQKVFHVAVFDVLLEVFSMAANQRQCRWLERKKRAQRIRGIACGDSFRRGRF